MDTVVSGIVHFMLGASLSAVGFLSLYIWKSQQPEKEPGLDVNARLVADAILRHTTQMGLEGIVYIVGNPEYPQVKIGYTERNTESRLKEIQTGSPFPLVVLAEMNGNREVESYLHKVFAPVRMEGEWFRLSHTMVTLIDGMNSLGLFTHDTVMEDFWGDDASDDTEIKIDDDAWE